MVRVLPDTTVISQLAEFYEQDLRAALRNHMTGADSPLPTNFGAMAALLNASLYRPEVALVWGKEMAFSQLDIWRPCIKHTKKRVAIFTKSLKGKSQQDIDLEKATVHCSDHSGSLASLAGALPSLTSLLYITDKNENFGYIRSLPGKLHIFASHGDSDKHSSMSRLSCAYDFLLVADSNAALRFVQNGIQLPLDRFVPIGGSIIEGVEAAAKLRPVQRLVYAPTWEGYGDAVDFSSLAALAPVLARWPGATRSLRFRPHPGTGKRLANCIEAKNLLGTVAPPRKANVKADDFNWSDAVITDVSGVLSEYLYTRKPIIMPVAKSNPWLSNYLNGTRLGEYVYFWDYENTGLDTVLEEATRDPLREARIARRERLYYNASTTEESCQLFEQAMEYFEMTRRLRAMTNPREAVLPPTAVGFQRLPANPALAEVVRSIREGTLALTAG